MDFVDRVGRYVFFTGKGGVGKTSLSCATAIALADGGKRVLLVSTDPASNLDEVLATRLGNRPTAVPTAPRLDAMNINPQVAAREYRERVVGPYRGVLPNAAVASIEEQLSGACTTEIAAFDEFSKLLADAALTAEYDHVVLDTAPTGHTLRLLALPAAWTDFLAANAGGTSCLGPLSGLQTHQMLYEATLQALRDATMTTVVLVSRPERTALAEADRTRAELAALGLANQLLVVNGVFAARTAGDPVACALESRGRAALNAMPPGLATLPRWQVPLLSFGLIGLDALRAMLKTNVGAGCALTGCFPDWKRRHLPPPLRELVAELAAYGRGVIMTMGKGGVGKTTIASAIAVALASLGHRVHLTTTDPAAHLDHTLMEAVPGLDVARIDPVAETRAYREEILERVGAALDAQGRRLLEEELRSPCTEEIAVFRAFAQRVEDGEDGFVVLDTAPTGHTLLLLDTTEAYHRQVSHSMSDLPECVRQLLPRLRDPEFTRVLIVTVPEATPVHEAAQLQQDLARAQITPLAWIINQSLAPLDLTEPVLASRQQGEFVHIEEVREKFADRAFLVPWSTEEPTGHAALLRLLGQSLSVRGPRRTPVGEL